MELTGVRKAEYEKLDDKVKASQRPSLEKRESIAQKAKQRYNASKASKVLKIPETVIDPLTEVLTQQKPTIIPAEESLNTVQYPSIIDDIARGTYYWETGASLRLSTHRKQHEMQFAQDMTVSGSKSFYLMDAKDVLIKAKRDLNLYEVLTDKIYPFIDIDCEDMTVNGAEMLTAYSKTIMGCLTAQGIEVIRPVVSCSTTDTKISYHVVFHTDVVFKNICEFGVFVKRHILPQFDPMCHIDWAIYTTRRCFRMLYQSKKGKGTCLTKDTVTIDGVEYGPMDDKYYLIGQYDKQLPHYYIDTTVQQKLPTNDTNDTNDTDDTNDTNDTVISDIDINYYDKLAYLVPDTDIEDYETCRQFIHALTNLKVPDDIIHKHCKRINYNIPYVNKHINGALTSRYKFGIKTIMNMIQQGPNSHKLAEVVKEYAKCKMVPDIPTKNDNVIEEVYDERYVKPFSLNDVSTIILQSHMGTGKTTQIRDIIQKEKYTRICVISARKSFVEFFIGDMYIEIAKLVLEEGESEAHHNFQISQHEQNKLDAQFVHYLKTDDVSVANRIVIQLESIHKLANAKPFDMVILDESESIGAQFSSNSTHKDNLNNNMRTFEKIVRDASYVLWADAFITARTLNMSTNLRPGKALHIINKNIPNVRQAIQLVRKKVEKGETKLLPALDALHNKIIDDLSKGLRVVYVCCGKDKGILFIMDLVSKLPDVKYKIYNSDTIDDGSLSNVNKYWAEVQLVIYTSSITIGTSYDNIDAPFDKLYLYATVLSCVPRDMIQALFRARKITSNTLYYTICNKGIGLIKESTDIKAITIRNTNTEKTHNSYTGSKSDTSIFYLDAIGLNEKERGMKRQLTTVLNEYLIKSGYSLSQEEVSLKDEKRELAKALWTSIENITVSEYLTLKKSKHTPPPEDRDRMMKFEFNKQIKPVCDDCMNVLYANRDAPFWRMVTEKHNTCDTILTKEKDTMGAVAQDKKGLKYLAMTQLYKLLNIDNCGYGFNVDIKSILPGLAKLEQTTYDAFSANGCRRNKKNAFTESNGAEMIKMMFAGWNGDKVKIDFVVGYKKTKIYSCEKEVNNTYCLITDIDECKIQFDSNTVCRNALCIDSEREDVYKPEKKNIVETVKCRDVPTVKVATMIKQSKATLNKALIKNELCKNDKELKPKKR